jgi:hypothetical protein
VFWESFSVTTGDFIVSMWSKSDERSEYRDLADDTQDPVEAVGRDDSVPWRDVLRQADEPTPDAGVVGHLEAANDVLPEVGECDTLPHRGAEPVLQAEQKTNASDALRAKRRAFSSELFPLRADIEEVSPFGKVEGGSDKK